MCTNKKRDNQPMYVILKWMCFWDFLKTIKVDQFDLFLGGVIRTMRTQTILQGQTWSLRERRERIADVLHY